jgi:hypothetical protein
MLVVCIELGDCAALSEALHVDDDAVFSCTVAVLGRLGRLRARGWRREAVSFHVGLSMSIGGVQVNSSKSSFQPLPSLIYTHNPLLINPEQDKR